MRPHVAYSRAAAHVSLQVIVLLWGCTAILGRQISIQAIPLVWYRLLIVVARARDLRARARHPAADPARAAARYAIVGAIIGLHWLCFYGAIKDAGIATAVLSLSTDHVLHRADRAARVSPPRRAGELAIGAIVVVAAALLIQVELHATPSASRSASARPCSRRSSACSTAARPRRAARAPDALRARRRAAGRRQRVRAVAVRRAARARTSDGSRSSRSRAR